MAFETRIRLGAFGRKRVKRKHAVLAKVKYPHDRITWTDIEVPLPEAWLAWWGNERFPAGVFACDVVALLPGGRAVVWCEDESHVQCAASDLFPYTSQGKSAAHKALPKDK